MPHRLCFSQLRPRPKRAREPKNVFQHDNNDKNDISFCEWEHALIRLRVHLRSTRDQELAESLNTEIIRVVGVRVEVLGLLMLRRPVLGWRHWGGRYWGVVPHLFRSTCRISSPLKYPCHSPPPTVPCDDSLNSINIPRITSVSWIQIDWQSKCGIPEAATLVCRRSALKSRPPCTRYYSHRFFINE